MKGSFGRAHIRITIHESQCCYHWAYTKLSPKGHERKLLEEFWTVYKRPKIDAHLHPMMGPNELEVVTALAALSINRARYCLRQSRIIQRNTSILQLQLRTPNYSAHLYITFSRPQLSHTLLALSQLLQAIYQISPLTALESLTAPPPPSRHNLHRATTTIASPSAPPSVSLAQLHLNLSPCHHHHCVTTASAAGEPRPALFYRFRLDVDL
ncbi:hypothetical protein Droror1_Dr00026290 [Drosera rotundifolia]